MSTRTVTLRRTRIEVPSPKNGRPGYRWTTGYYVVNPDTGRDIHPPVQRSDAYRLARELGATKVHIVDEGAPA